MLWLWFFRLKKTEIFFYLKQRYFVIIMKSFQQPLVKHIQAGYKEFGRTALKIVQGKACLHGVLYRNGPAVLSLADGKEYQSHWFGGNGGMLSVQINGDQAFATYQLVRNPKIEEELKSNRFLYHQFFKKVTSPWYNRFSMQSSTPGNTSVLVLKHKVLALCQGHQPIEMGKQRLQSYYKDSYPNIEGGWSAHYKIEPQTGHIYNFGQDFYNGKLILYRFSQNMTDLQLKKVYPMPLNMIHDMCLTTNYLIIFQQPFSISRWELLLSDNSFGGALKHDPSKPTIIHVFRKTDFEKVGQFKVDKICMFHFTNGYDNKDQLTLQFINYKCFDKLWNFLTYLPIFTKKDLTKQECQLIYTERGIITDLSINLSTKSVSRTQLDNHHGFEFPVVSDKVVGKKWHRTYGNAFLKKDSPFFDTIGYRDRNSGEVKLMDFGRPVLASEPMLVDDDKHLLTVLFDPAVNKSYVCLIPQNLQRIVCEWELPQIIPPSFHGKWQSA